MAPSPTRCLGPVRPGRQGGPQVPGARPQAGSRSPTTGVVPGCQPGGPLFPGPRAAGSDSSCGPSESPPSLSHSCQGGSDPLQGGLLLELGLGGTDSPGGGQSALRAGPEGQVGSPRQRCLRSHLPSRIPGEDELILPRTVGGALEAECGRRPLPLSLPSSPHTEVLPVARMARRSR